VNTCRSSLAFYYPYAYQNLNWYNFPYLWPAVAGGFINPTAPYAAAGTPLAGISSGGCPQGFCPNGASCSQYAGQWQCGCGLGGCAGSKQMIYSLGLRSLTIVSIDMLKSIE
jgi:hypothetical protein